MTGRGLPLSTLTGDSAELINPPDLLDLSDNIACLLAAVHKVQQVQNQLLSTLLITPSSICASGCCETTRYFLNHDVKHLLGLRLRAQSC